MSAHTLRLPLTTAALLSFLAAMPVHAMAPADGDAVTNPKQPPAMVTVHNANSLDVHVYAATEDGRKIHLGKVRGSSSRMLQLPESLTDGETPYRLKIYTCRRAYAGSIMERYLEGVKTKELATSPGEEITLIIESPIALSYISH